MRKKNQGTNEAEEPNLHPSIITGFVFRSIVSRLGEGAVRVTLLISSKYLSLLFFGAPYNLA